MSCSDHHELFVPPDDSKAFCVQVTLAASGADEVEELLAILDVLVADNERWIQSMLDRGIRPPCCARCGGVKYRQPTEADYKSGSILFKCAPTMFRDGVAACGTVAAYDVAALRILEGADAWVVLLDAGGPSSYHAIVGTPAGEHDPTLAMVEG